MRNPLILSDKIKSLIVHKILSKYQILTKPKLISFKQFFSNTQSNKSFLST